MLREEAATQKMLLQTLFEKERAVALAKYAGMFYFGCVNPELIRMNIFICMYIFMYRFWAYKYIYIYTSMYKNKYMC